jgi:hypothetical protein
LLRHNLLFTPVSLCELTIPTILLMIAHES